MSFENTFGEAIVLFNERQYKKAIQKAQETDQYIQTITERAELLTRTANLENFKGHVYIGLNDYKSAKASFEKAISIIPNLPDALAGYSKALVELNDKQTALTAASRAFDLDPGNRIVQFYLSEVLHGVGKTNEAKTILLRYLQQQPKDIDAMETLLKVSGTEEKKKNGVKTELTLVTGVYGSGKSTFAESLGFPVFQIDSYFNYTDQKLNYRALKTNIDFVNYFLNDTLEQIVLDGYLLHIDDNLSKLKQVIAPISKITVKFIYTEPEELYASQRSTPERIANREKEKLSKEEDMIWNQKNQHMLRERFEEYLNKGIISNIEYIYREGDNYSIQNADHFMETVGEVIDWRLNKWELLRFVSMNEDQPYQTIEYEGEIIRPGTEQCWLSWENISKFDIDWKGKYVLDIGSYFGYFSLKVLQSGAAKVKGIDQSEKQLKVYREMLMSNHFNNFDTEAIPLGNGNIIPGDEYDIIMALNMLHHVQRNTTPEHYDSVLNSIFSSANELVFEINDYQVEQIINKAEEYGFELQKKLTSHRNTMYGQRYLFHFKR